nr:unnamed protein product [Callosobruchus chinensis]
MWLALKDPAGLYLVTVHSDGPAYEVPSYCSPDKGREEQMTTTEENITYSKALPKYTYNISITTTTSCGTPAEGSLFVTTLPSTPAAPKMEPVFQDKGKTTFYWSLPCDMNGAPDYFTLSFHGHSLSGSAEDSGTKNVSAKGNLNMFNTTQYLRLAFNYSAKVSLVIEDGLEGPASSEVHFTTPDGVPGKPTIIEIDATSTSISVFWNATTEQREEIDYYNFTINPIGPLYPKWHGCDYDYKPKLIALSGNDTSYVFMEADPYYEYELLLRACSSVGCGEYAKEIAYTKESAPDNVQEVKITIIPPTQVIYNEKAQIQFKSCRPNGNRTVYSITMLSSPDNDGVNENYTDTIDDGSYEVSLQPEYHYRFMITIDNGFSRNQTTWYSFNSTAGVPATSSNTMIVMREGSTQAEVTLIQGYLNESNGRILYIALILSDKNITGGDFSQWNGRQWPPVRNPGAKMYHQITDDWWYPFKDTNEAKFIIGSGGSRNEPLDPDKGYYLIVRLFTSSFYRNSEVIYFRTVSGNGFTSGIVVGVVVGVLLTLTVFTLLFFIMRRRMLTTRTRPSDVQRELKKDDTLFKFIEYCKALDEDPDKLSSQFEAITTKGKEIVSERTSSFARLPENWRKNRYVNILPYDDTRVKLLIDEDDEIGSDYINASYIEGYTGKAEYIATQGPLLSTCRDFWKMVLQEDVHVIVMVSQFIVNKKEKCFKYFPEKGKTMIIGDDMEIRCTTELHFGTYCVRTIQVKKGNVQASITHMQFLEWPDFGVPFGTEHMLQFCYQVRRRINQEGGCVIVHCR